jgi:hypothetical protein
LGLAPPLRHQWAHDPAKKLFTWTADVQGAVVQSGLIIKMKKVEVI